MFFTVYFLLTSSELIYAHIFTFILLLFNNPIIAFNINLLNTLGYSLYLPIFTISTVILPILVGKVVEHISNNKKNSPEGIFNKIRDEYELAYYEICRREIFKITDNDIENNKEVILPSEINNLTREQIFEEINCIINDYIIKRNEKDELKTINSIYVFFVILLISLPLAFYFPIFSTIGLTNLTNTFVLNLIYLIMGMSFSLVEANNYNNDLKVTVDYLKNNIKSSNFEEKDLELLLKAHKSRIISEYIKTEEKKLEEIEPKEETLNKENFLDVPLKITKIAPKLVDCEFKRNPEEKRNNKILVRRK